MLTLNDINFMDFYFNGHFLSEFGGYVGSADGGLKTYSLLPERTYITDKPLNYDGNIVFDSYLEPREFTVPIVFDSIDDGGIRQIAGWLNTKKDEQFYFADDSVYINCTLDSNNTDFSSIGGDDGECELNFIANDPYYYALNSSVYNFENTQANYSYNMINAGNSVAYPIITVETSKGFKLDVLDINQKEYCSFVYQGSKTLSDPIVIDTKYCMIKSGDINLYNNIVGEFPVFPTGVFYLRLNVSVPKLSVEFKPRYI